MKNILLTTAIAFAMTTPVFAAGTHSGGHGHEEADASHGHAEMAAGMPGKAEDVTRTIDVSMRALSRQHDHLKLVCSHAHARDRRRHDDLRTRQIRIRAR